MPVLARLQRAVTRTPPSLASATLWVGITVAASTLARLALDPLLGSTLWFPTYYPAALIGTLFLGWRSGVVILFLSALAANFFFVPPRYTLPVHRLEVAGTLVFLVAGGLIVAAAGLLRTALIRLQAAHEREKILNAELQHRIKNTLAIVQGLVAQTARRGIEDPREFRRILEGRLGALAIAHDLVSHGQWETYELADLAVHALAPFRDHGGIIIEGPSCTLNAEACVPLSLALHELATNAVKYGALSVPRGSAELTWRPCPTVEDDVVVIWKERDGPAVTSPKRQGLGTRLLTRQTGLEQVTLQFDPDGVRCEIRLRRTASAGSTEKAIDSPRPDRIAPL